MLVVGVGNRPITGVRKSLVLSMKQEEIFLFWDITSSDIPPRQRVHYCTYIGILLLRWE